MIGSSRKLILVSIVVTVVACGAVLLLLRNLDHYVLLGIILSIVFVGIIIPLLINSYKGSKGGGGGSPTGTPKPKPPKPHGLFNPLTDTKFKKLPDGTYQIPVFMVTTTVDRNKIYWDTEVPNATGAATGLQMSQVDDINRDDKDRQIQLVNRLTNDLGYEIANKQNVSAKLDIYIRTVDSTGKQVKDDVVYMKGLVVDHVSVRGMSSRGTAGNSYTLKLAEKVNLFNFGGKYKKYDMYCPYLDHTSVRNVASLGLGNLMNTWSSPAQVFQLYLNNLLMGNYILLLPVDTLTPHIQFVTDKISWDQKNLQIGFKPADIDGNGSAWNSFTNNGHTEGGCAWNSAYCINDSGEPECQSIAGDHVTDAITFTIGQPADSDPGQETRIKLTGAAGTPPPFVPSSGCPEWRAFNDGDPVVIPATPNSDTMSAMQIIKDKCLAFTKYCFSDDLPTQTLEQLGKYIDVDSFVIFFICGEIRNDNDTYRHNMNLSIDEAGIISMGPLWDMDLSLCNSLDFMGGGVDNWRYKYCLGENQSNTTMYMNVSKHSTIRPETEPAIGTAAWIGKLFGYKDSPGNAAFKQAVKKKWSSYTPSIKDKYLSLIDFYVDNYKPFLVANFNYDCDMCQNPAWCKDRNGLAPCMVRWADTYNGCYCQSAGPDGKALCANTVDGDFSTGYQRSIDGLKGYLEARFAWLSQPENFGHM